MDRLYAIDPRAVVWDILDGEAVMLHRESGDYFSADGTGCLIWQWIAEGHGRGRILDALAARFAADAERLAGGFDGFIAELLRHGLVQEAGPIQESGAAGDAAGGPADEALPDGKAPFVPPALNVYSDIRNLLLLDPIHDVDDSGWPEQKPADPP
ncbi:MAG: PqqD family protein [Dongiaceae bacterium]